VHSRRSLRDLHKRGADEEEVGGGKGDLGKVGGET